MALNPEVYQQEQARVRERFASAVELAEQAFTAELQRLVSHLAERLTDRVRKRLIRWFRRTGLLDAEAADDMLAWPHSGFSIDASVRIGLSRS